MTSEAKERTVENLVGRNIFDPSSRLSITFFLSHQHRNGIQVHQRQYVQPLMQPYSAADEILYHDKTTIRTTTGEVSDAVPPPIAVTTVVQADPTHNLVQPFGVCHFQATRAIRGTFVPIIAILPAHLSVVLNQNRCAESATLGRRLTRWRDLVSP